MNYGEYARQVGVRATHLKLLDRGSPAHLRHAVEHPDDSDTPTRVWLRAVHALALEPAAFRREYSVFEGRRTGKLFKAHRDSHPGTNVLNRREYDSAVAIVEALYRHPLASPLLCGSSGESEHNLSWTDLRTQLPCIARLDRWLPDLRVVVDLKTVGSTAAWTIERMTSQLGWDLQMAHYVAGAEVSEPGAGVLAFLLVVEAKPPHDVAVYRLAPALMLRAAQRRGELLDWIAECNHSGRWPGRFDVQQTLELPAWAPPEIGAEDLDEDLDEEAP